ncbi:MAG: hypothetical protein C0617_06375 [Desulfuromonas sp.]|uniref:RadC family protein n=1 Tax=Desulfuromonas sp. TaxID=892 RepID=UPI000CC5F8E6|nr:DNA repair protein RadC [Desulfuromonas sp.]PLX84833.1 MAG: hypothetical protein C0617_06375 [Desulfuromonas sp.]
MNGKSLRTIKDWPEEERPREKLLGRGAGALSDAELLALVLRTGTASAQVSAVDLARLLLDRFDTLQGIAGAAVAELCRIPGVGPAKAAELQAVFEIARRSEQRSWKPGERFTGSKAVFHHFQAELRDLKREVFLVVLLDNKNRLLRSPVRISEGSLTASIVHPREVFTAVVRESAAAVLFVHNHPSGDPAPSREDLEITSRLREAGELMGVRVLDHIIIGRGRYVSLADRGLMG